MRFALFVGRASVRHAFNTLLRFLFARARTQTHFTLILYTPGARPTFGQIFIWLRYGKLSVLPGYSGALNLRLASASDQSDTSLWHPLQGGKSWGRRKGDGGDAHTRPSITTPQHNCTPNLRRTLAPVHHTSIQDHHEPGLLSDLLC